MLKDEACWRYLETEIEDPTEETGRLSDRCFGSQHILKRISNCWGNMDFPYAVPTGPLYFPLRGPAGTPIVTISAEGATAPTHNPKCP
ncbi:MAG TPA: hypothetical protein VK579_15995, partial [Terriglobales bacterium]|nr:hypothetical protein [Terriglobales bacterium]